MNLHSDDTFSNQKHYSEIMLTELNLFNLPAQVEINEFQGLGFVLKTCQRTLVLNHGDIPADLAGYDPLNDQEAYLYLLEVICGLQSRLIGENEIVSQFKKAYQDYVSNEAKDNRVLLILEKLFKDAKLIRSQYLTGISQKTYASLTRKEFVQKKKADKVVILGSGQLAQDLINQFVKHTKVILCARNLDKVSQLQNTENCEILDWQDWDSLGSHAFICNTIGFNGTLLDQSFFQDWSLQHGHKLFVDLGSPSCVKTHFKSEEGVLRLDDIFNAGAIHEEKKWEKIRQAQKAIIDIAQKRKEYLKEKNGSSQWRKSKTTRLVPEEAS